MSREVLKKLQIRVYNKVRCGFSLIQNENDLKTGKNILFFDFFPYTFCKNYGIISKNEYAEGLCILTARRKKEERDMAGSEEFDRDNGKGEQDKRNRRRFDKRTPLSGKCEIPDENTVVGRNAVLELLKSGRFVDKLFVRKGEAEGSLIVIIATAKEKGIPVIETEKTKLDALSGGLAHQGVVAMAARKEYCSLSDILHIAEQRGEPPFLLLCDGVDDPGNLGALIRCAEGAGVHGVVIAKRRSVGTTAAVDKSSAGALEHMAVAKVSNLSFAIEELKKKGLWIYGAEAGGKSCYGTDMKGPLAVVVGSEGRGLSRLVAEKCDFIVSIEMYGKVNSFNVSCAAAVILCEAARQRHGGEILGHAET